MAKPLNRAQSLQNQQFLRELRRTGNVRLAAGAVGLKYSTIYLRRRQHPAFATRWDAAIAFAQARFNARGRQAPRATNGGLRTVGGEPVIVRRGDGKLQMRTAHPGNLTKQSEQAFLSALSATANVRLSATAAGAAVGAFYRRKHIDAAFAREWRLALAAGYERLEMALLESAMPRSYEDDAWRHNDPPAMPPMTVNQALQLMYLHQKEARLGGTPELLRRRAGETREVQSLRLQLIHEHRMAREQEKAEVAEAARRARGEPSLWEKWEATKVDLAQVQAAMQAASEARCKTSPARPAGGEADPSDDAGFTPASGLAAGEDRALFGGRRLGDVGKKGG